MVDRALVLKEAQKYLAKGLVDKAIAEWEKLLKESPDANTFNIVGDLYLKKGDSQKAIENFHRAARVFRDDGFSLKALAIYKKVLNVKPSDADSLYALGELNEEKDIATDAIRYYLASADMMIKEGKKERLPVVYDKIVRLAPSNIPLRTKIAEFFSKEGFVTEAANGYFEIAKLYERNGDAQKSRDFFVKTLEIQPGRKEAYFGLCDLYEKKEDFAKAFGYLKTLKEKAGEDVEILLRGARLLGGMKSYAEAMSYASRALELDSTNMAARKIIGDIYINQGEMQKAWDAYKEVLDEMIFKERYDEAIETLSMLRDVDPAEASKKMVAIYNQTGNTEAAFNELLSLTDVYFGSGMLQDAMSCLKEASNIYPDDERLKERTAEIEKALGIEPTAAPEKTIDEVLTEADIFLRYGLHTEAKDLLEGVKVRVPENMDVHLKLKSLYLDTDNKEMAVTECIILAQLYGRAGDGASKDAVLKEAFEISPEDARLEKFRAAPSARKGPSIEDYAEEISEADFYVKEGLYHEAGEIYKRLLRVFPDNEDLKAKASLTEEVKGPESAKVTPAEVKAPEEAVEEAAVEEAVEEAAVEEAAVEGAELETISMEEFIAPEEALEAQELKEPTLENDVLEIFQEFKKGLEKELEEEDSETHYNLGIAYKEMGLIDDAIKEFQTTKHDPKFYMQSASMLGICYMQKGLYPLAVDAFSSALMKVDAKDDAQWSLKFDLAEAYEKNGNIAEAFKLYTDIYGWNSMFRHVSQKINSLKTMLPKAEAAPAPPRPQAAAPRKPGEQAQPTAAKDKKSRVSYI